ncbi:MAG: hypothetical protein ACFE9S_10505 [Candidatus Hermodarchaeota archaeon]
MNALGLITYELFRGFNIDKRENRAYPPEFVRDDQFNNFIAENTPPNTTILVSNNWLTISVNTRHTFPRRMIYFTDWSKCSNYPDADFAALSVFSNIGIEDICQEKIEYILIYDYEEFAAFVNYSFSYLVKFR